MLPSTIRANRVDVGSDDECAPARSNILPQKVEKLTLGAGKKDIIVKVILPSSMPGIWDSFRIMIGAAWTFVIIAEIVGASSGLGHLMVEAQRFLRTDSIFAGIFVIGMFGLATDYFFKITYRAFFPWVEHVHA